MAERNYAAVLYGPKDLRVVEWPIPEIGDKDVLIKMECVGICGSDVKLYQAGRCGLETLVDPIVIGHEGAGYVAKVGSKVDALKVGDRVAIEPTQPCRACEMCKQGRYNVCDEPGYCATSGGDGNLTTYYKHVADFCHRIPENLSMEEGAAVQPVAIAIHACNRAGIKLGTDLVIFGAGPIGVLCAQAARAMGATKILITDVVQSRLDAAKTMGVDLTLLTEGQTDKQTADTIVRLMGCRPHVTIDACGFASAQRVAMMVTRTGGVVTIVGIGGETTELPLSGAVLREVDIRGSYRIANTYPAALAAVSKGVIDLAPFITHHFPLERAREAIDYASTGQAMKIIIHVQK
ncbi:sorbitol dehydrogenase-like [Plodia interpunctella]|uniref:sorbitol dehydrogenase-like n=1 Tax=Plodia interpunctella TaxID=58824 RepID=UPI00236821C1|nr:sorbitol dehydrogenase-like [Plodia interpunctella]